uniref:Uncharacterized protein n=1 Tax=Acrobeloides nanus TaxID=290746 RepID=A0A914DSI8_9BILA
MEAFQKWKEENKWRLNPRKRKTHAKRYIPRPSQLGHVYGLLGIISSSEDEDIDEKTPEKAHNKSKDNVPDKGKVPGEATRQYENKELETALLSQPMEGTSQPVVEEALNQGQNVLKKRPTDFDIYHNSIPDITFSSIRDLSVFNHIKQSRTSSLLSSTIETSQGETIPEKETISHPGTANKLTFLSGSSTKWKTPFVLPQEVQISTPQEDVSLSALAFDPGVSAIVTSMSETTMQSQSIERVTRQRSTYSIQTSRKDLRPTFEEIAKLVPKRPANESLRKIAEYSTPISFLTPKSATRSTTEITTAETTPKSVLMNTNVILSTTPVRTSSILSTTIEQENEKVGDKDEPVELAKQFSRRLQFYDSQSQLMDSNYWGETVESTGLEEDRDENREKLDRSSYAEDLGYLIEDFHEPDYGTPGPSTMQPRKTLSRLLDDSIIATEVSTPKAPLLKTAMLRWASQTPEQPLFEIMDENENRMKMAATNSPATDSPPIKHVVFGRGESPEYVLAKPKLRTYQPTVIDARLGIRHSSRTKIRPLKPWLNEKPLYELDADLNPTLVGVQTVEVKEKRAKKYLSVDPFVQFERERGDKARRKKMHEFTSEMKLRQQKSESEFSE